MARLVEKALWYERALYNARRRVRLKNRDFTIIASNCVGTMIYHDMGLPFLTPTINLTISMRDLVEMAGNLRWYMEQELIEVQDGGKCPAGRLGSIRINFVHYDTFEEGAACWERRKKRINWDNIILMGVERDDCDYAVLKSFDQLPYPNKVVLTHIAYPELSSACYIKGFEERAELGVVTNYRPHPLGIRRRYMDAFDYVAFLNRAKENRHGAV